MTIRRAESPPQITHDDLQFTHRGRTFGVELTEWDGLRFVMLVEQVSGAWSRLAAPTFAKCTDADIAAAGGPAQWIATMFLPELNKWLADLFPPAADVTTLPPFDQVDALLARMIVFKPRPDGTIVAALNS